MMRAPVFPGLAVSLLTLSMLPIGPLSLAARADTAAPAAPAEISLPAISVARIEKRTLTDRVLASGLIGAVEEVLVQPQIEGQAIESIAVEVGDAVTKGQVLARLSDSSFILQKSQLNASWASAQATIAQAEAQLIEATSSRDEAMRVRDRTIALAEQGAMSAAAKDTANASATSAAANVTVASQGLIAAKAQLTLVEAQIANVDLSLERTLVAAPVAGEVVERNAMVGAIASGGASPMFTIVRDGLLELRADVAEQDILRLQAGQKVLLQPVGLARPLTGTVWLVEPTVDTVTRLGRVRIGIDESSQVRSGMFADAEIIVAQRETLVLPVSAVGGSVGQALALKVTDGLVDEVTISTGIRDGGFVEVTSGLSEGDMVVVKAGAFVRDGDHINPVVAKAATDPIQISN